MFNYLKEVCLFVVCVLLVKMLRQPLFISWALIFVYLLADDALGLHELFGWLLFQLLPYETFAGVHFHNVGEFLFFLLSGAVLLIFLWQAHRYSTTQAQRFTHSLLPWLFLLASLGVIVDALHVLFMEHQFFDVVFTMLEDGGEMIVLSVMFWKTKLFYEATTHCQMTRCFEKSRSH